MRSRALFVCVMIAACSHPTGAGSDGGAIDGAPRDAPDLRDTLAIDAALDAAAADAAAPSDAAAAPLDPFVALQQLPGDCADGWCWKFPTPNGNRWIGVYGTGNDNIWLWGARGTIAQWDGQQWTWQHPPALPGQDTVALPWQITGRSKNDMWLILESAVEHWDGATWTIVLAGPTNVAEYYTDVWVAPSGDVWVVSPAGVYRSQNGGPFVLMLMETDLGGVWGTADNDIFIGGGGTITHYDGSNFTLQYVANDKGFGSLMGFPNDVWTSGENNTLMHYDGAQWSDVPTGLGSAAQPFVIRGVAARASNDVWWIINNASQNETFLHWDGTQVSQYPLSLASYGDSCCPTWGGAAIIDGRWWLVTDNGGIYTKVSDDTLQPIISPAYSGMWMWGASDNDMYFAGGTEMQHWDGSAMTTIPTPWLESIDGVAGAGIGGADELFSYGLQDALHFDGQVWTQTDLLSGSIDTARFTDVRALGAGDAMYLGAHGFALHYQNGIFIPIATGTTADLIAAWGPDRDHLWISGTQGTVLQWNRNTPGVFTPAVGSPVTTNDLGQIAGVGSQVWIADPGTTFLSIWDGSAWSQVDPGSVVQGVYAVNSKEAVITQQSGNGQITRWDGTEFTYEDFRYETTMNSVFEPPGGHMWLTNGDGVVQHL
jgi:hypothetical protein